MLMPTQNDQKQVILDAEGKPLLSMQVRPKGEIRDITHLRHALDASVMAFASILLPDTGKLWEQLMTRKVPSSECVDFNEKHGWSGILKGAGVIFFAYIGFDAVSTAAQETKNPQKDMFWGMIGVTLFGLIFTPVFYVIARWISARLPKPPPKPREIPTTGGGAAHDPLLTEGEA